MKDLLGLQENIMSILYKKMTWTTVDGIRIWYEGEYIKVDPVTGNVHLAIFDVHNCIFYSASDIGSGGAKGPLDYVLSYPNVETLIESMADWTIVFVADKLDDSAILPWMKWVMIAGNRKADRGEKLYGLLRKMIQSPLVSGSNMGRSQISAASFYCSSEESNSIIPLDVIRANNIAHYVPREIFSSWPGQPLISPSIRGSGKDMIVLVGSSGSGRDEASKYLISQGYIEVRRKGDYMKRIQKELRLGNRVFFNATNPKLEDRAPFIGIVPEVRIWWFVRPGRIRAKDIPEIAFTRYSKSFEVPSKSRDSMPVVRLT